MTASEMYYNRTRMLEPFQNYDLKLWVASYPPWLEVELKESISG